MYRPAASLRLASAPATVTVTTGRGNLASAGEVGAANALGEAVEDRFARKSLFRLAAAWRACPKAEASLSDEGAGPLFEAVTSTVTTTVTADERAANASATNAHAAVSVARVLLGRVTSR